MRVKARQPILKLLFQDYGYFIEGIPIEVINEKLCTGTRILSIKRIGSTKRHEFMIRNRDKKKKLNCGKELSGIILKPWIC